MKLASIHLDNFRNFYGEHFLEFSVAEKRPITVLIGENGSGKTTLLNAIFWVFTGKNTKLFKTEERLINRDAYDEGKIACSVSVRFEVDGVLYELTRKHFHKSGENKVTMLKIGEDGDGKTSTVAEAIADQYIKKIMPPGLANWFIFDGEAIDQINLDGDTKFKADLRKTFGFEDVDDLIVGLKSIVDDYARAESRLIKSTELDDLNESILRTSEELERTVGEIENTEQQIEVAEKDWRSKSLQLESMEHSAQWEKKRSNADARRSLKRDERRNAIKLRAQYVARTSGIILLAGKASLLEQVLYTKEKAQSLPQPVTERLIQDIRNTGRCICGTEILPGSDHEHQLIDELKRASTGDMNNRISHVRMALAQIGKIEREYESKVEEYNRKILQLDSEISELDAEFKLADEKIKNIPNEVIRRLRDERDSAHRRYVLLSERKGALNSTKKLYSEELLRWENRRTAILSQQSRNIELKKQREKAQRLLDFVINQNDRQEAEVLSILGAEISSAMKRFLTKHYDAKIDPRDYKITTHDSDGRPVVLSTGETNVLKFSVIAAIVGMAGSKTKSAKVNWISDPIIAPLVFDAPFSHNDTEYQVSIATNLSDMAGQLIFLVDKKKWTPDIATSLGRRLGKMYLIVSRAKGAEKGINKEIELNGKLYPLNEYGHCRDDSKLIEVCI